MWAACGLPCFPLVFCLFFFLFSSFLLPARERERDVLGLGGGVRRWSLASLAWFLRAFVGKSGRNERRSPLLLLIVGVVGVVLLIIISSSFL